MASPSSSIAFYTEFYKLTKTSPNKVLTLSKAPASANPSEVKDNKALTIDPSAVF